MGPILVCLTTFFVLGRSAPTNYDQRQDGKLNVQAELENFLFVFATPADTNLLNELTAQVLEQSLSFRHGASKEPVQADSTTAKYEVEDTQDKSKEPYRVEIVRIERDEDKKSRKTELQGELDEKADGGGKDKAQEGGKEALKPADEPVETKEKEKEKEKKGRSLASLSHSRAVEDDGKAEDGKKQETGKAEGDKGGEREKGGKARNVWTRVADPGRPGQSLKKELSRKEGEREKNDVGSQNKPQELMLLGEGIENCGPGRFRDRAGICQVDESFH